MGATVAGIKLGRYEVFKHLTTGGMAEVLLARASGLSGFEHHVVIKRLRPAQAKDERFVKMFLEEARLAASLHHQNIVKVHELGEQHGEYFFTMEYVHGEDVNRLIVEVASKQEKFPIEEAVAIIMGAASGLHYAHEQIDPGGAPLGLVHRDVSPGNILVGYDGSVKVVDFGIAKATMTRDTRSGVLKGKISYMSPEQIVGLKLDRRSDVWSLGVVLYETLTGRKLFRAASDFMTMAAIVDGAIPPLSEYRPDLPPALQQIVMKALASKRDERFQTAEELHAALERFLIASDMRTSTKKLADFMHHLFGERVEPWLVHDAPTAPVGDFDRSPTGVVPVPDGARKLELPKSATEPSSLIVQARRAITDTGPVGPDTVTDPDVAPAIEPSGLAAAIIETLTTQAFDDGASLTITGRHVPDPVTAPVVPRSPDDAVTGQHLVDDEAAQTVLDSRPPDDDAPAATDVSMDAATVASKDLPDTFATVASKDLLDSVAVVAAVDLPDTMVSEEMDDSQLVVGEMEDRWSAPNVARAPDINERLLPMRFKPVVRLRAEKGLATLPRTKMPRWLPWLVLGAVVAAAIAIAVVIGAWSNAASPAPVAPRDAIELAPPTTIDATGSAADLDSIEIESDEPDPADDSSPPKQRKRKRSAR